MDLLSLLQTKSKLKCIGRRSRKLRHIHTYVYIYHLINQALKAGFKINDINQSAKHQSTRTRNAKITEIKLLFMLCVLIYGNTPPMEVNTTEQ